jgi:hypothetical protein
VRPSQACANPSIRSGARERRAFFVSGATGDLALGARDGLLASRVIESRHVEDFVTRLLERRTRRVLRPRDRDRGSIGGAAAARACRSPASCLPRSRC